jgi:hypothetical protein
MNFWQGRFNQGLGRSNRPAKFLSLSSSSSLSAKSELQGPKWNLGRDFTPFSAYLSPVGGRWSNWGSDPVKSGCTSLTIFFFVCDSTAPHPYPFAPLSLQRLGTPPFVSNLWLSSSSSSLTPPMVIWSFNHQKSKLIRASDSPKAAEPVPHPVLWISPSFYPSKGIQMLFWPDLSTPWVALNILW